MLGKLLGKSRDLFEGKVPEEFLKDIKEVKKIHERMTEVVRCMEKMVHRAIPSNPAQQKSVAVSELDEFAELAKTCDAGMYFFYEQRCYYVLKTISNVGTLISRRQKAAVQEAYERSMLPLKVWVDEEYHRLIRDLQRCQKLKKESESASIAFVTKPNPARETKAQTLKAEYDLQLGVCRGEMEKTMRIVPKHQINCFKIMVVIYYNMSKSTMETLGSAKEQMKKWIEDAGKQKQSETGKSDRKSTENTRDGGTKSVMTPESRSRTK